MIRYLLAMLLSAGAVYIAILYESTAFTLLGFDSGFPLIML